jgi:hypothetical protein
MYPELAWVILHFEYAQSWNQTHSQKTNIRFYFFFMPSFIGLNLLLCGVFWEKRLFLITNYEFPVTFPHQEIHNPKFPHLKIVRLVSQLQFEKDHLPFFKTTFNVFLGFHK